MIDCVILLGSNIDPWPNLRKAVVLLAKSFSISAISRIYFTEPDVLRNQPWFLNAALRCQSKNISMAKIREELKNIERELGRVRGAKHGPRKIDLDLVLAHGPSTLFEHPDLSEKGYMLIPVSDVASGISANCGKPLTENVIRWRARRARLEVVDVGHFSGDLLGVIPARDDAAMVRKRCPSGEDERLMGRAIELARKASRRRIIPVGAIISRDGVVVGEGCNEIARTTDPTAHAEVVAIRNAAFRQGRPYLEGCIIYTTLEPCGLCTSAIMFAKLAGIVFGAGRNEVGPEHFDLFPFRLVDFKAASTRPFPPIVSRCRVPECCALFGIQSHGKGMGA